MGFRVEGVAEASLTSDVFVACLFHMEGSRVEGSGGEGGGGGGMLAAAYCGSLMWGGHAGLGNPP